MKINVNDSRAPFTLAMLAMDMQDYLAAEKYFKKSVEVCRLYMYYGAILHKSK